MEEQLRNLTNLLTDPAPGWILVTPPNGGNPFYFNPTTNESQTNAPLTSKIDKLQLQLAQAQNQIDQMQLKIQSLEDKVYQLSRKEEIYNPQDNMRAISNPYDRNRPEYGSIGKIHNQSQLNCKGQWVPSLGNNQHQEWIQIDCGGLKTVAGVQTQGRGDGAYRNTYYVRSYQVSVSHDGQNFLSVDGGHVFNANYDDDTIVTNRFRQPILTRYVRIYPIEYSGYVCLRAALVLLSD
eukprot:TRINITY_DN11806_c0_g1_i1.p1 TRINITY_DN11806_c0_g1~~TRINITY_DN11806_c0_g1_i1.p1  ORF type:complete len:245 (-),score=31.84 TRINITY_DN11806_c0_g1_i1:87-797(-)